MDVNFGVFCIALIAIGAATVQADVNLCQGVADQLFLPYIGNCSNYYICLNGNAIAQACESGYNFDAKQQSCLPPDQAQCLPTCSNALSSFCYDRTCTKYVLCYAGKAVLRECCDGLQYNSETDRCDFPEYVDCVDNMCTIFDDPTNIKFLSSKASCSKYYICMDGYANAQTCSAGLNFNSDCNCCDYPDKINCTITAMQRNILPYSKSPPQRADIECPTKDVHFLPNRNSIASYIFCNDGRGVILECTPGLVYDSTLNSCRTPENLNKPRLS